MQHNEIAIEARKLKEENIPRMNQSLHIIQQAEKLMMENVKQQQHDMQALKSKCTLTKSMKVMEVGREGEWQRLVLRIEIE